jgi:hypothetical protein
LREISAPLVADCKTPAAARRLNQRLFPLLKVRYATDRKRPDQCPGETISAASHLQRPVHPARLCCPWACPRGSPARRCGRTCAAITPGGSVGWRMGISPRSRTDKKGLNRGWLCMMRRRPRPTFRSTPSTPPASRNRDSFPAGLGASSPR